MNLSTIQESKVWDVPVVRFGCRHLMRLTVMLAITIRTTKLAKNGTGIAHAVENT